MTITTDYHGTYQARDETLARELEQIARELLDAGDERWYPLSVAADRLRWVSLQLEATKNLYLEAAKR